VAITLVKCEDETEQASLIGQEGGPVQGDPPSVFEDPSVVKEQEKDEFQVVDGPWEGMEKYENEKPQEDLSNIEEEDGAGNFPLCEKSLEQTKHDEIEEQRQNGFNPEMCNFVIKNKYCEWDLFCETTITDAPDTEPETTTSEPEPEESSESKESCEVDREIRFDNCYIKIRGRVERH
jgi:hypothetical protein